MIVGSIQWSKQLFLIPFESRDFIKQTFKIPCVVFGLILFILNIFHFAQNWIYLSFNLTEFVVILDDAYVHILYFC